MKTLLRTYLFCLFSLWLVPQVINAVSISGGLTTLSFAALALTFLYLFIKPILKIFFLPINLLSLGLFSWAINTVLLYLLTLFIPQIKINAWQFNGFSYQGFIVPSFDFNQILTFILVSFLLSGIISFSSWLSH